MNMLDASLKNTGQDCVGEKMSGTGHQKVTTGLTSCAVDSPASKQATPRRFTEKEKDLKGKTAGSGPNICELCKLSDRPGLLLKTWGGASTWKSQIKSGLESAGYTLPDEPIDVSAESVGAPHLRRRLFWIANRDGKRLEITRLRRSPKTERQSRGATDGNAWLSSLPGVLRVDDGIPGGMDRRNRIECCGNSVSPIVVELLGREIMTEITSG